MGSQKVYIGRPTIKKNNGGFRISEYLSEIIYDRLSMGSGYSSWLINYDISYYDTDEDKEVYNTICNRYNKLDNRLTNSNKFCYCVNEYNYDITILLPYDVSLRLCPKNKNIPPSQNNINIQYIKVNGDKIKINNYNFDNKQLFYKIINSVCIELKNKEYISAIIKLVNTAKNSTKTKRTPTKKTSKNIPMEFDKCK